METKDRILMKSLELFHKYGIRQVTMDEIASQLGMSKKTIYSYYADKDELVDAVACEHIKQNTESCECDRIKAENAVHEIFLAMDMVQEMFATMNPTVLFYLEKYHYKSYQKFSKHKNEYMYKIVFNNLKWGIEEGLYRSELNLDIISKFRIETMFLPFNIDVFTPGKFSLTKIELEIMEHFLYGVVTSKGQKLISKYKEQRLKNK